MKRINEYKAIILDMDGTLYFQPPLRAIMAIEILLYYMCHPWKIKDLFILKYYRSLREKKETYLNNNFINEQYSYVAKRFATSEEHVKRIIKYWIYNKPLKFIRRFKDDYLINRIHSVKKNGTKIIVYSDYPAEEKIDVLGLKCDYIFSANDNEILCLKPNTKGLEFILKKINIKKDEVLFIGDRYEKDGECAKRYGIDFLILSPKKKKRFKQIKEI